MYFANNGMTVAQIGVLMSMIQVLRIVGPNVWGYVADHYDRRVLVLLLAGFAALVAFSGVFTGSTFAHFMLAMILLNLFTSGQAPICEALMLSEMRGDLTFYGRIRLWGSVGFIVAVTLVLAFFTSTALMVAAHTSLYTFYSLYLERHGYSKTVIGAMWSLGVAAEVLLFYFQSSLLKRWGRCCRWRPAWRR